MADAYLILEDLIRANTEVAVLQKDKLKELSTKDFPFDNSELFIGVLKRINKEIIKLFEGLSEQYDNLRSNNVQITKSDNPYEEVYDDLLSYTYVVWSINYLIHNVVEQSAREHVAQSTVFLINQLTRKYVEQSSFLLTPIVSEEEHNFLYWDLGIDVRELIQDVVDNSNEILEDLKHFVVLSFPHIYKDNIVTNVLLAHEVGHFIVDVEGLASKVTTNIRIDMTRFGEHVKKEASSSSNGAQNHSQSSHSDTLKQLHDELMEKLTQMIERWIIELLSDMIGFRITGPVFALALAEELFSIFRPNIASEKYPPTSYRLKILLDEINTQKFISMINEPTDKNKIETLIHRIGTASKMESPEMEDELMKIAFDTVDSSKDKIKEVADEVIKEMCYTPDSFGKDVPLLLRKLEEIIPPCEKREGEPADIITILNAGMIYKMTWMLEDKYKKSTRQDIEEAERTINALVLRAIEMSVIQQQMLDYISKNSKSE